MSAAFDPELTDHDRCAVCHSGGDASAMGKYLFKGLLRLVHLRCAAMQALEPIDQPHDIENKTNWDV